jgi:hypothetical protein
MGSRRGVVRLVREGEASWRRKSRVLTHDVCRSGFCYRLVYVYQRQEGDKTHAYVETCDLNGAHKATVLADEELAGFDWISVGRFIFSRWVADSPVDAENLWEQKVDEIGNPKGEPRQLTDWSGFLIPSLSARAAGNRSPS